MATMSGAPGEGEADVKKGRRGLCVCLRLNLRDTGDRWGNPNVGKTDRGDLSATQRQAGQDTHGPGEKELGWAGCPLGLGLSFHLLV